MSTSLAVPGTTNGWPPLARVAAAGYGAFALGVVITGALNPGYSHVREAMSALAAMDAKFAWVMITGFMCLAVGLFATAAALWRRFAGSVAGRGVAVLVAMAGGLIVASGVFRQDCSEQLPSCVDHGEGIGASTHFWVHQYVGLGAFLIMLIALFVLARALRKTPGLTYLAIPTRVVAFVCLAVLIPSIVFGFEGYQGLVQRPLYALLFGWPILAAGLPRRG